MKFHEEVAEAKKLTDKIGRIADMISREAASTRVDMEGNDALAVALRLELQSVADELEVLCNRMREL